MIKRHDILRTSFIWERLSEPAQVVWNEVPSMLTNFASNGEINDLEQRETCQISEHYELDLTQAPLLQLVFHVDYIGIQLSHHLIMDLFALERLHQEVYAMLCNMELYLITPTPFRNLVAMTIYLVSAKKNTETFSVKCWRTLTSLHILLVLVASIWRE